MNTIDYVISYKASFTMILSIYQQAYLKSCPFYVKPYKFPKLICLLNVTLIARYFKSAKKTNFDLKFNISNYLQEA